MLYILKDFSSIRILGCFIFVACLSAHSQDSLVYKNGVNLAVKIVSVSQRNPKNKEILPDVVYTRIDNEDYQLLCHSIEHNPNWNYYFDASKNFLFKI
jgi:hypothetical protein